MTTLRRIKCALSAAAIIFFLSLPAMGALCPVLSFPCNTAAAENPELADLAAGLTTVAAALGTLMIAVQGLRWITSETPQDRADAKKGLTYILIGLLIVAITACLVEGLYCQIIKQYFV